MVLLKGFWMVRMNFLVWLFFRLFKCNVWKLWCWLIRVGYVLIRDFSVLLMGWFGFWMVFFSNLLVNLVNWLWYNFLILLFGWIIFVNFFKILCMYVNNGYLWVLLLIVFWWYVVVWCIFINLFDCFCFMNKLYVFSWSFILFIWLIDFWLIILCNICIFLFIWFFGNIMVYNGVLKGCCKCLFGSC